MIGGAEGSGAPWWLAASAVALWLLRETWGAVLARRKERTETDANVDLLNGLVERVKSLEASQAEVVKQYNEEVRLRMTHWANLARRASRLWGAWSRARRRSRVP